MDIFLRITDHKPQVNGYSTTL